jgi:hypothetical protein
VQRWLFRLGCQTQANEGEKGRGRGKESEGKNKTQETISIKIVFFVRKIEMGSDPDQWVPIKSSGPGPASSERRGRRGAMECEERGCVIEARSDSLRERCISASS